MDQNDRIYRRYGKGPVGPKGLATMGRILDALAEELTRVDWHEISVPHLATIGDFSPSTFYQYYKTVAHAGADLYHRERAARRLTPHLRAIATLLRVEHPGLFTD